MLIYIRGLAAGHIDYLARMPQKLLINILEFLNLEDISRLAQTSKAFNKVFEFFFADIFMMNVGYRKYFYVSLIVVAPATGFF